MSTTEPITNIDAPEEAHPASSRRALIGKGAMVAAVAATAGMAVSKTASAADGGGLLIATPNSSTTATDTALTGGSSLIVTDGASNGSGTGSSLIKSSLVGKQTAAGSAGVVGSSSGAGGWGLWGEYTSTAAPGVGVIGASSNGSAVVGAGTVADFEAAGSGKVVFTKGAFAATPPTGASVVGTLAKADDGSLWYSPVSGQWLKLAGASGGVSAGTFHIINPVRVYDSRLPSPAQGKIATGQNRVVSVADARNEVSGLVTTANVVPAGANAVVANLTVTETEGDLGGFLSVVPGDATALSGSSINWSGPNQNIANGLTAKIAADRTVKVFCGGIPTPKTQFIIDITGYWM